MEKTWRRGHYTLPAPYLMHLLGIEGELVALQHDPLQGYVSVITTDSEGPEVMVGEYVEPKSFKLTQTRNEAGEVTWEAREWC